MGLDMYLYKKTYVQNWDHTPEEKKFSITIKRGGKKFNGIKSDRISYIIEEVGYWRKFNALHRWFVQNCADGVDDCKEMHVGKNELKNLVEKLKKVKEIMDNAPMKKTPVVVGWENGNEIKQEVDVYDVADQLKRLLPTSDGFFFGGTEYGEYYYEQVCSTIDLFEQLFEEDGDYHDFYYQASW